MAILIGLLVVVIAGTALYFAGRLVIRDFGAVLIAIGVIIAAAGTSAAAAVVLISLGTGVMCVWGKARQAGRLLVTIALAGTLISVPWWTLLACLVAGTLIWHVSPAPASRLRQLRHVASRLASTAHSG